ncbi:MAG: cyclic nucleotide-binding domain-containing protein [SAR324 cluster bacterium]|nr:cyclic nucleotide-binding domain-containing protein [SAR324 cluster bacterium]
MEDAKIIIYQNLRKSRHFEDISDEALNRFLALTEYEQFKDQQVILKQGEPNQIVYILVSGKAIVKVDGKYIYTLQRKGDVIGEMSVVTGKVSSATIEAVDHLDVIGISTRFLTNIHKDSSHELHYIFYKWFSHILSDKLFLTSQKAKLHEDAQKTISLKNEELEKRLEELKSAYEKLQSARIELEESKKVTALIETFQKFVPEQFLNRVAKEGLENITVGDAESDFVTVLFSDIRNFTTLSESLTPQEIFKFLSAYLSRMSEPIHKHGGFIDKFIGDAIMAIFNRPGSPDSDEAQGAIQAAIGLYETLQIYNQHRKNCNYPPLDIGIGIHSGPVMMGTVGSESRMDFTVIGDTVNVASRLESLTKYYQVPLIISYQTHRLLDLSHYHARELDTVKVKGKSEKVVIYEVFSGFTEEFDKKCELLPIYNRALIHYQIQDWDEAIHFFNECLKIFPQEHVSQLYLERCQNFKKNPPASGWEHVFQFNEK